ncbi:MAG: type II secretion system protein M [Pseudomonadota bacterium]
MNPLRHTYENLGERDRAALKLLRVFAAALLLFYGILQPVYHYYKDGRERLQHNRDLLSWVQDNAERAALQDLQPEIERSSEPLIKQVSDSALNLTLDRVQPEGDKLRVWINQANFADVLQWLTLLATERQIHVGQISIEQTQQPGMVKVQVSLR